MIRLQRWESGPYFAAFSLHIPDMRRFLEMREIVKICPRSSTVSLSNSLVRQVAMAPVQRFQPIYLLHYATQKFRASNRVVTIIPVDKMPIRSKHSAFLLFSVTNIVHLVQEYCVIRMGDFDKLPVYLKIFVISLAFSYVVRSIEFRST